MRFYEVAKVLSYFLFLFFFILFIPLSLAAYFQFLTPIELHPQPHSTLAFLETALVSLNLGILFQWMGKKAEGRIYRREGILILVAIWLMISILGSLPFYFSGTLTNPIQSLFESVSGFTTTGSTVMEAKAFDEKSGQEIPIRGNFSDIEKKEYVYYGTLEPIRDLEGHIVLEGIDAVSRALIFWRSFIQWMGGLGIMVLFVAILPALGVGGKVLLQSEATGPIKGTLTPRVKETALQLLKIYASLTLLEVGLLMWTNPAFTLFDAIILSFSTISTGGFTPHNNSIEHWKSFATEWIIIAFMILGSTNFSLFYYCLKRKFYKLWDVELIGFFTILLAVSSLGTYQLYGSPIIDLKGTVQGVYGFFDAATDASFQLIAAMTSTGFYTTNYDFWPPETQVMMLILMFVGGMSGSTAGGIKIIRHILLLLLTKTQIETYYRPETVRSLKVSGKEVDSKVAIHVFGFFFLIISISVFGTFLYSVNGVDPETSLGLTGCMVNNVGLGFRQAGAMNSCAFLSDFSCLLSCLLMLLGRLEFLVVLVLLVPAFWKEER